MIKGAGVAAPVIGNGEYGFVLAAPRPSPRGRRSNAWPSIPSCAVDMGRAAQGAEPDLAPEALPHRSPWLSADVVVGIA